MSGTWKEYRCCAGTDPTGKCCGKLVSTECPSGTEPCCACLEAIICPGCMVSSTRVKMMLEYNLRSDPLDNQIIHCQNAIQFIACIVAVAGNAIGLPAEAQDIMDLFSTLVFLSVSACMNTQIHIELKYRKEGIPFASKATSVVPQEQAMARGMPVAVAVPVQQEARRVP